MASNGFTGTGWAFPVRLSPSGQIQPTTDDETTVRDSIWMILNTSPGERMMRPDFGCPLDERLFDVNDASSAAEIASTVQDSLALWEPRIDVLDVQAAADPAEPRRLLIDITFQLRSTNSRLNLVYPLYLE